MKRVLMFVLGPPILVAVTAALAFAVYYVFDLIGWMWGLLPWWVWVGGIVWIVVGLVCLMWYEDRTTVRESESHD